MEHDCLFCQIVAGTIPSEKVYEDKTTYAFLDIHPVNPGHTLVIPKIHASNIYDIPQADFCTLMETVRRLAPLVKKAVSADGINIGMNNDGAAGQLVFHAHIHIIPRFEGDGHHHWHSAPYQEGEMPTIGSALRAHIEEN
jgi:histidine triad (HIT) family protein